MSSKAQTDNMGLEIVGLTVVEFNICTILGICAKLGLRFSNAATYQVVIVIGNLFVKILITKNNY